MRTLRQHAVVLVLSLAFSSVALSQEPPAEASATGAVAPADATAPEVGMTPEPSGDASPEASAEAPPTSEMPESGSTGDLTFPDFDATFGEDPFADAGFAPVAATPSLEADEMKHGAQTRRLMLQIHQGSGIATWLAMATATTLGMLNIRDLYQGGDKSGRYLQPHRISSYALAGTFSVTGGLALFAPEPYERTSSDGIDTATLHRIFVSTATAGMVAQIALGFVTARRAEAGNRKGIKNLATTHQVVGLTTMAALTSAALVWVF